MDTSDGQRLLLFTSDRLRGKWFDPVKRLWPLLCRDEGGTDILPACECAAVNLCQARLRMVRGVELFGP